MALRVPVDGVPSDLNHDGKTDFTFFNATSFYDPCNDFGEAVVWSVDGGSVVGQHHPSALMRGANIGPSAPFLSSSNSYSIRIEAGYGVRSGSDRLVGDWGGNPKNRYLGVCFLIDGKTHYGWVRLTIHHRAWRVSGQRRSPPTPTRPCPTSRSLPVPRRVPQQLRTYRRPNFRLRVTLKTIVYRRSACSPVVRMHCRCGGARELRFLSSSNPQRGGGCDSLHFR